MVERVDLPGIALTRWGSSTQRIVMVHGGIQGGAVRGTAHFAAQQVLADQGYELLIPDRPGHGLSPANGHPDDSQADGLWVAQLLGDGSHLVGHSFGAAGALAATAQRPDAVTTLTLIEPGMQAVALQHPSVIYMLIRLLLAQRWPAGDAQRLNRFSSLMRIPADIGGRADSAVEAAAMGQALLSFRPPQLQDLRSQLQLVRERRIPLLVVSGGWSKGIDMTSKEVANLGGGKHVILQSPHHFPQLSRSNEFNYLLTEFIKTSSK